MTLLYIRDEARRNATPIRWDDRSLDRRLDALDATLFMHLNPDYLNTTNASSILHIFKQTDSSENRGIFTRLRERLFRFRIGDRI